MVTPEVNGLPLTMELDTGASLSIISRKTWKEILPGVPLEPTDTVLRTYSGESLEVLGQIQVHVRHNGQEADLPLVHGS